MVVYKGADAAEVAAVFRRTRELPEGMSVVEGADGYIAVFNPDDTMVRPEVAEFRSVVEAEDWLGEMDEIYQRQYWRGEHPIY